MMPRLPIGRFALPHRVAIFFAYWVVDNRLLRVVARARDAVGPPAHAEGRFGGSSGGAVRWIRRGPPSRWRVRIQGERDRVLEAGAPAFLPRGGCCLLA